MIDMTKMIQQCFGPKWLESNVFDNMSPSSENLLKRMLVPHSCIAPAQLRSTKIASKRAAQVWSPTSLCTRSFATQKAET